MTQGGIADLLNTRVSLRSLPTPSFPNEFRFPTRLRGPLLTLAVSLACYLLGLYGVHIPAPFPILVLTIVYAALTGGLAPALVSALLTSAFALLVYAERPGSLASDSTGIANLLSIGGAAFAAAFLAARAGEAFWRRSELTRSESELIRWRLALLEQTSGVIASAPDFESALPRLARLLVNEWAEWCTIHLVSEGGEFRFVGGAHRNPNGEVLVRALADEKARAFPFGAPPERTETVSIDQPLLQAYASEATHLKALGSLAGHLALRMPLREGTRLAGLITLGMRSSRRSTAGDVALADELAGRISLAIENAALSRKASESDERFQLVFDSNPQAMWLFDVETLVFLAVNDATVRQYGYSRDELLQMSIMDLFPRQDHSFSVALTGGDPRPGVALSRHQRKDGSTVEVELISQEVEFRGHHARLACAIDVSERMRALATLREAEEQVRDAHRMNTVGRIASGIAHDFNNLLTSIRGFGEILDGELGSDDPSRTNVERIVQAADRGALLTRQLIAFGGRQPLIPQLVSLNDIVSGMEGLIGRLAGDDVRVETRLSEGLGRVHIDPSRLEQAVVSLILSAREAMVEGGTLSIETYERYMGGFPLRKHLTPGQYAVLAIGDRGRVSASDSPRGRRDRLEHEGLGLRVVSSIVRQSGGVVRTSSEPGEGKWVKIYLPMADDTVRAEPSAAASSHGSETVLVVEDENGVRELVRRMLADAGYETLEASDGPGALRAAEHHIGPIHLLVTDVVMTGMGGGELAAALLNRRPQLEVLYISGYAERELLSRGVHSNEQSFLSKPFTRDELLNKVRDLLDKRLA